MQGHAAQDLGHVDKLDGHAQVLLEEVDVHLGARDAHRAGAEVHVRLAPHLPGGDGSARKGDYLLCDVRGNGRVVSVLYIMAVNLEGGQTALGVRRHRRGKVYGARALRAVEAPDRLEGCGVEIERLGSVAPARGHRQRGDNVFVQKLATSGLGIRATADGTGRHHALHRLPVRIAQRALDKLLGGLRHRHGLPLKGLAHSSLTAIDGGSYTNLWIVHLTFNPFA